MKVKINEEIKKEGKSDFLNSKGFDEWVQKNKEIIL